MNTLPVRGWNKSSWRWWRSLWPDLLWKPVFQLPSYVFEMPFKSVCKFIILLSCLSMISSVLVLILRSVSVAHEIKEMLRVGHGIVAKVVLTSVLTLRDDKAEL